MPRGFSKHWWDSRGWAKPYPGEWETPGFEHRPGQTAGAFEARRKKVQLDKCVSHELFDKDRFNSRTLHRSSLPIFMAACCHFLLSALRERSHPRANHNVGRDAIRPNAKYKNRLAIQNEEGWKQRKIQKSTGDTEREGVETTESHPFSPPSVSCPVVPQRWVARLGERIVKVV
jgi:hypothetical protein